MSVAFPQNPVVPAAPVSPNAPVVAPRTVALAGNPNAGKTTLFNALTGMRQKVGNYPGVTVDKKEGRCRLDDENEITILDLPGTYSLSPKSPDEEIARDVLLGLREDTAVPDAVVVVVDASNLERNLYLATQVLELGLPTIIALNMTDIAAANGRRVDAAQLSHQLGAPVIETVALRGEGLAELRAALANEVPNPRPPSLELPPQLHQARAHLAAKLAELNVAAADGIALRLLCGNAKYARIQAYFGEAVARGMEEAQAMSGVAPERLGASEAGARYAMLGAIAQKTIARPQNDAARSFSDRADAILTHKVWGLAIFAFITLLVFQAIFSWASYPMEWIDGGLKVVGEAVKARMADGALRDLLVNGIIAGVGAVLVFLPQILVLFFFIGLLEDTGYMARAAFLMDRLMARVGLHGRAFIPLLSSFACAIPGIMATRTISNRRDRMTTILIAPLMTCSARLPVYTLMIATFIPATRFWGIFSLPAMVMFSLYLAGVLAAMGAALVFKKTLFKGPPPPLMLELPPYKIPSIRNLVTTMWERASMFLKRAGTVILAISIVLWFLLSYPKIPITGAPDISPAAGMHRDPAGKADGMAPIVEAPSDGAENDAKSDAEKAREDRLAAAQLDYSFGGRIGHAIEPLIKPLGFNWKIGIGLIGAMSAREVFVSTMGTVYSVGEADEESVSLKDALRGDKWPDGRPVWNTLVAVSLLVYFVFAMQCLSTLAVVRRETGGWKWPLFMQVYMTGLAWLASFAIYQIGSYFGWGFK